jgi:NhaP-type Na+/H+ or K+/H+ antiporter
MILHTTYGVVLLTLIVQGLTIKPLLRGLHLNTRLEAKPA